MKSFHRSIATRWPTNHVRFIPTTVLSSACSVDMPNFWGANHSFVDSLSMGARGLRSVHYEPVRIALTGSFQPEPGFRSAHACIGGWPWILRAVRWCELVASVRLRAAGEFDRSVLRCPFTRPGCPHGIVRSPPCFRAIGRSCRRKRIRWDRPRCGTGYVLAAS